MPGQRKEAAGNIGAGTEVSRNGNLEGAGLGRSRSNAEREQNEAQAALQCKPSLRGFRPEGMRGKAVRRIALPFRPADGQECLTLYK
jgi:hypothetical protein